MSHIAYVILSAILMLPGIAGVLVPALPGIPLMFLIALGYGFVDKFEHLSEVELAVLLVLALASLAIDYMAGLMGAKWGGASAKSTLAGFVGLLLGIFLFPPFGGLLGLFLAILYVESRQKEVRQALRAASGSVIGSISGIAANLVLAIIFLVAFVLMALR